MREKTDQFHEKVIFLDEDGVLKSDEFLKRHTKKEDIKKAIQILDKEFSSEIIR